MKVEGIGGEKEGTLQITLLHSKISLDHVWWIDICHMSKIVFDGKMFDTFSKSNMGKKFELLTNFQNA